MEARDILKLVDAGFTHDEILALAGTAQPETAEPPKDEAPAPQPETKEQPAQPAPEPAADPNAARYTELLEAMQKLTGAIQAGNILNSSNREDPQLSPEDILAEVVNPKPKRKG